VNELTATLAVLFFVGSLGVSFSAAALSLSWKTKDDGALGYGFLAVISIVATLMAVVAIFAHSHLYVSQ
jgi:hypothetical protein